MSKVLTINSIDVEITNQDKILFPEDKITKGDLVKYYQKISPIMLPLIYDRPITMHRFPNGIDSDGFYQKDLTGNIPKWVKTKKISKKSEGSTSYAVCDNPATLIYLANLGVIEPHIWLSKIDKLHYPDRLIFDFDSEKPQFKKVCKAAKIIKEVLDKLELESFVMTTGSKGLHVVVPLNTRKNNFDFVKNFARNLSQKLLENNPELFTLEIRKEKRGEKIFIDFLRNAFAQTGVAPYGVRAKPGAPVATPLSWSELDDPKLTAQKYNIKNIFKRISRIADPWAKINKIKQTLPKII